MLKQNYFNFCALTVLLVLYVTVIFRHMLSGRRNRYFRNLLLVTLGSVLFDILAVTLDNASGANVVEKYIAHGGYLFFHNLSMPAYVIYLTCLTDTVHKLKANRLAKLGLALPIGALSAMILLSPLTHAVFYIDENFRYVRGPWYILIFCCVAFYVTTGMIFALRCKELFEKGHLTVLLTVFAAMILALGVQILFPHIRIEMFVHSVGILLVFLMVQRPEERMDSETGFYKYSAYVRDIEQAMVNKRPVRLILIQLLNYRALSDVLGYESTRAMIVTVSESLLNTCRRVLPKADPYYLNRGRYCLIVGKENFDLVESAAEAINDMLREDVVLRQLDIELKASVCIARCPEDLSDFQSVYAFNHEMEDYERTGRVLHAEEILKDGRYIIHDIEGIIDEAIENNRLSVFYQPIYSVEEGRFVSAEALLRLDDKEYGHVSPELFIPVAEKRGTIHQIGSFVLDEVCKFVGSEEFQKLGVDYIEVNLSVMQCMRGNLVDEIMTFLDKYHVKPSQINLEVTETAAFYSQNIVFENMQKLTDKGLSFSLDDFGTGYSNMRRVASLPLNLVKLDKTFTDFEENPKMEIVARNTIRMIKDMDLKIVVEGIENEKTAALFSDLGCDYIQGYYYSKPLPKDEYVEFVRKANQVK